MPKCDEFQFMKTRRFVIYRSKSSIKMQLISTKLRQHMCDELKTALRQPTDHILDDAESFHHIIM